MAVKAALFLMSPLDWNSAVVSVWGWGVAMGTTTTPGGGGPVGVLHSCHGWLLLCLGQCLPAVRCAAYHPTLRTFEYSVAAMVEIVVVTIPTIMLAEKCRVGQRSIP